MADEQKIKLRIQHSALHCVTKTIRILMYLLCCDGKNMNKQK